MFRKIAVVTMILCSSLGMSGTREAEAKADIASCAKIADPTLRLACFDGLAKPSPQEPESWGGDIPPDDGGANPVQGLAPQGYQRLGLGEWAIRRETLSDGSSAVVLATVAKNSGGSPDGSGAWPVLIVRCADERTFIYVNWNRVVDIGGRSTVEVDIQVDDGEPNRSYWSRYTDHRTTGFWSSRASVAFAKELFGKSSLVAKLNEEDSAFSAQFNISGLEPAVTPLRQACDW